MFHRTRRILLLLALLIGSAGMSYVDAAKAILAAKANDASYGRVRIGNGNWTTTQNASTSVTTATGQSHVLYASPFTGYHFVNWTNNINTTTSTSTNLTVRVTTTSALYTANFAINTYTITASPNNTNYGTVTGGGTYNYGASATLKATPKTGYHFVQWNDGVTTATRTISNITANATYTATFAINTYTITFKNEDGTSLGTQTVNYNVKPTPPSNPTQAATAQYTYTFKAWSPTIAAATKDQTYTATYTATVRSYTIRFMNGNTPLQTNTLKYGATPNYTGSTPTKASTAQYSYTFNGWSPAIYAVNKAQDYTAQFKSTVRSYKITGASANTTMGTVSGTATKQYGQTVTLTATPKSDCYEFLQWNDGVTDNPRTVTVTGTKTYTATFGVTKHGYCGAMVGSNTGTNLTWTLDECTGRLTISGTGEMRHYCSYWTAENWWGNNYYCNKNNITTVIINNGVTSIGDCAFWQTKNLTSVTLPNTFTYLGDAFHGCSSLVSINLPNSITYIDDGALAYCTSLTSVTIPNKLTEIISRLFDHCTSLSSVTIPNNITTIGEYAFYYCALTSVTIPKSVTSIGECAFKNNEGLTDIYVSWTSASELPAYPKNMVSSPSTTTLHIPCGTGDIYRAASGWSQFKIIGDAQYTLKATSPSSAQGTVSIDDGTAGTSLSKKDYCETIHTITATPAGCYDFIKWSDGNTDNPRTVTLNSNVTYTAQFSNTFSGTCGANGNNLTWSLDNCTGVLTISGSGAMKDYERTGDNCAEYSSSAPWIAYKESITSIVLPVGLTRIGNYAFYLCRGVTDIDLPAALLSIGNYAFAETGLRQVCVPEGVTTIGSSAFSNMCFSSNSTPLKRVYLPNSLTSIGAYALSYNPLRFLTYPALANSFSTPYRGAYPANEVYASWKTDVPSRQGRIEAVGSPQRKMHIPYGTTALYRAKDWARIYQLVEDVDERAIDLGLSIRWASCNIGATAPEENGNFYAWGDTLTRSAFTWSIYPYCGWTINTMTKYCTRAANGTVDNRSTLIAFDDAAYINWGETWRMPTWTEWNELITQCTWKDTTYNNVSVWQVTGPNGNSIYLPKVGYKNSTSVTAGCYYWSSTLNTANSNDQCNRALYINAANRSGAMYGLRYVGMPVRAVYRREWPSFTLTITDTPESTSYTKAVNAGSSYTLTAQEDDCHHFVQWSDGNTSNPRTVSVTADATYTAVYEYVPLASGTCGVDGDNLTWTLSCDGVLTISGTGEMANYPAMNMPWKDYRTSITSVIISEGVTTIGAHAFNGCSHMTSLTVPSSLTSVGQNAFTSCWAMESVYISDLEAWCNIDFGTYDSSPFSRNGYSNYVGGGDLYVNDTKVTTLTIPDGITEIKNAAFYGCACITDIQFNQVTSIGREAFNGCHGLTEITIPEGVTAIGQYGFTYCSHLQSISIPASASSLGTSMLSANNMLTDIYVHWTENIPVWPENFTKKSPQSSITLHVPCAASDLYHATDGWNGYNLQAEGGPYTITVQPSNPTMGTVSVEKSTD